MYGNDINKLDSMVGGLLEKNHRDSMLGETFTIITATQFEDLRDGDRLFYLNQFKGDPSLIHHIESTSLADVIARTTGIDHIYRDAFAAHERIGGTAASETLNGTAKGDLVIGYDGDDLIRAGGGNDDVYGGKGQDNVHGSSGNDHLNGEEGNDHLWGGQGCDTFVFECGGGRDTVRDFNVRQDMIDLSDHDLGSFRDLKLYKHGHQGRDTLIDLGDGDAVVLQNVKTYELKAHHFVFEDSYALIG